MFHCPVGVWFIEPHAITVSTTVCSPTVYCAIMHINHPSHETKVVSRLFVTYPASRWPIAQPKIKKCPKMDSFMSSFVQLSPHHHPQWNSLPYSMILAKQNHIMPYTASGHPSRLCGTESRPPITKVPCKICRKAVKWTQTASRVICVTGGIMHSAWVWITVPNPCWIRIFHLGLWRMRDVTILELGTVQPLQNIIQHPWLTNSDFNQLRNDRHASISPETTTSYPFTSWARQCGTICHINTHHRPSLFHVPNSFAY